MYSQILVASFYIAVVMPKTGHSVEIPPKEGEVIGKTTTENVPILHSPEEFPISNFIEDLPEFGSTELPISNSTEELPVSNSTEIFPITESTEVFPVTECTTENLTTDNPNPIENPQLPIPVPPLTATGGKKVFKKLRVPLGTELSLTAQVSKPKILPSFFFDDDGIILDAVIELPITLTLDKLVETVYHDEDPFAKGAGEGRSSNSIAGKERCFMYKELENFIASLLPVSHEALPNPKSVIKSKVKSCILRAICETQSIAKFYNNQPHSLLVEMVQLILSPSSGAQDGCSASYVLAESLGKSGRCLRYSSKCPVNILSVLLSHTFRTTG